MPKECYFYREIVKYTEQVRRYLEVFGRENVHIIIYDDLKKDVAQIYRHVCDFLDVDRNIYVDLIRHNVSGQIRSYVVWRLLCHPSSILRLCVKRMLPKRLDHTIINVFQAT